MKFSLTRILLVATIVVLSVVIGNISSVIRVGLQVDSKLGGVHQSSPTLNSTVEDRKLISNDQDDIIWFLQISDLHISIFHDMDRLKQLEEFCKETVDAIKPTVVLASGDLTDAKTVDTLGSRQYIDEWKLYRSILDKCEVSKKTVWLDVRGNHDNFNVNGPKDEKNYYLNYSMQGGANPRSYLYTTHIPNGKIISFIALDACLEPGPKRPFNFFGLLNQRETKHIQALIRKSRDAGSAYSVWFGHYPTSTILSSNQGVRALIASDPSALVYLCGHLHTMAGLIHQMYTLQQAGFLELEVADWKDSRRYRLAAIDHGLFSFVDVSHNQWPVVLVTNPKHALFHIPDREPLYKIASSTHIRVLAFSTSKITSVKVQIDNGDWQPCIYIKGKGPLYVLSWNPQLYSHGLHQIKVEVIDEYGRTKVEVQPFSIDGSRPSFPVLPRILLMTNATTFFQAGFGLAIISCVVPLSLLRLMLVKVRSGRRGLPTTSFNVIRHWYKRLWILANINKFYYPLVLYPLYVIVGPWTIGEIIDNHIGVIFAWGTFVSGAYLPGSFTYAYGIFQMATYQFPLTMVLAYKLEKRLHTAVSTNPQSKALSILRHWWADLPLYIVTLLQLLFLYFFWLSYGWLALLLVPFRTWPLLTCVYLWRRLQHTPLPHIQELADIFEDGIRDISQSKSSHSI